jgi:hypothetical protein
MSVIVDRETGLCPEYLVECVSFGPGGITGSAGVLPGCRHPGLSMYLLQSGNALTCVTGDSTPTFRGAAERRRSLDRGPRLFMRMRPWSLVVAVVPVRIAGWSRCRARPTEPMQLARFVCSQLGHRPGHKRPTKEETCEDRNDEERSSCGLVPRASSI